MPQVAEHSEPMTPTEIRFAVGDDPHHALLEFDTPTPIRILLTKGQLERLIYEAGVTAAKLAARDEYEQAQ